MDNRKINIYDIARSFCNVALTIEWISGHFGKTMGFIYTGIEVQVALCNVDN